MTRTLLPKRRILMRFGVYFQRSIQYAKAMNVSAVNKAKDGDFRDRKQEIPPHGQFT